MSDLSQMIADKMSAEFGDGEPNLSLADEIISLCQPQWISDEPELTALKLYKPPFTYNRGYIWDAENEMVADEAGTNIIRVRGWGRISYLDKPEELQDTVGELIAKALTEYWENHLPCQPEESK